MARPRSDIEPRIVRAARRRFLQEGVDGASLRRIARDARTSIGMVYYYFPTKDDLFLGVVEETYAKLLADMTLALSPDAPVKERIRRLYARVGAVSDDELATVKLVVREVLVSSSRFDRLLGRFQRGHLPLVWATLAEGAKDGSIRGNLPPALLFLCTLAIGTLPQLMQRALGSRLPFDTGGFDTGGGASGTRAPAESAASAAQLVGVLFEGIGAVDQQRGAMAKPSAPRRQRP